MPSNLIMSKCLNILFVEDTPLDAELSLAALEGAGYSCTSERVENREDFLSKLNKPDFDIVLSDYSLPSFDGLTALKLFVESGVDAPFILISGTLGEETAIESLKAGASDFVLKDKLFRLPSAVDRALREKEKQRQMKEAEQLIRLQALALESAANAIALTDAAGTINYVNDAFKALTGYSRNEAVGNNLRFLKSGRTR